MKSIKNNKILGKNGLKKEFFEIFWDKLKTPLMESINRAFYIKNLKYFTKVTCNQGH